MEIRFTYCIHFMKMTQMRQRDTMWIQETSSYLHTVIMEESCTQNLYTCGPYLPTFAYLKTCIIQIRSYSRKHAKKVPVLQEQLWKLLIFQKTNNYLHITCSFVYKSNKQNADRVVQRDTWRLLANWTTVIVLKPLIYKDKQKKFMRLSFEIFVYNSHNWQFVANNYKDRSI